MPKYRITGPDGGTYEVNAPDGATEQDVLAYAQQNYQPAAQPNQAAPVDDISKLQRAQERAYAGTGTDQYGRSNVGRADFSGVTASVDSGPTMRRDDGALTEAGWEQERQRLAEQDPLGDTGWYRRYLAGVGLSGVKTIRGLKQAAYDQVVRGAEAVEPLLARIDPGAAKAAGDRVRGPQIAMRQQEAQLRRDEAPITNTAAGLGGEIVGTVGQMFAPGAALRGSALGRLLMPSTVRGSALQGLAMGGIQPVADQQERATNSTLGALAGAGGAALPKVAGSATRLIGGAVGRPTLSGAEQRAAQIIRGEASSLQQLMQPSPSTVPGVQRTLAEETLDPGIARLERQVRGQSNLFQPIDTANNAARVQSIGRFAGDDSTLREAQRARTAASKPLLDEAYLDKGVDVQSIRTFVEQSAKENATRPSVQSAILDVQKALDNAGDDVVSLYGVRKYIGDLLSGKAGGEKTYAKAASAELKQIQEVLDEQIAAKSPAFAQYLDAFRSGSKPINRMQVGQQLLAPDSGGAVLDPQTGLQVLTPASFSKKARDLDAVAAKATGFKKARAADSLMPEDIVAIRAVQDDLQRQAFRATAGSGGNSMTAERLALQDKIGSRLAGRLPIVGGLVDAMNTLGNQRVNTQLARMIAEPAYARSVLSKLSKSDRAVVTKALIQIGSKTGASVPALTE